MTTEQIQSKKYQGSGSVLKWICTLGVEAVWALLAFLVCAAFLLAVLKHLFPEETANIRFFNAGGVLSPVSLENSSARFQMNLQENVSFAGTALPIALLSRVENEVKHKKADGIVWGRAEASFKLFERDAVQTLKNARAMISFDAENFLEMDEKSLVIIQRLGGSRILRSRRSFRVVMNGRLRGRIDGSSGNVNLQIALPTGLAEIDTRDSLDQKTEFEINVAADASTTLTVFKGFAKVSANGKTVEVNANEATFIENLSAPARPEPILDPVSLKGPSPQEIVYYRDFPPEILFSWQRNKQDKQYRFQIEKDKYFVRPVFEESLSKSELSYGNLKKGIYFWRVAAVDVKGVRGQWSRGRKIEVVQLLTPPRLVLSFPEKDEIINEAVIVVRGISDAQAKIYINGDDPEQREAENFTHKLSLKKGMNLILVESVDQAGNVSFERRLISRKF